MLIVDGDDGVGDDGDEVGQGVTLLCLLARMGLGMVIMVLLVESL